MSYIAHVFLNLDIILIIHRLTQGKIAPCLSGGYFQILILEKFST